MKNTIQKTEVTISKLSIYKMTLIGVMTAIICIMGPLSVPLPFTVIPITLTNLAIFFTVFILGYKMGTISVLIYLLVGLIGMPVFSGFSSGFAKLAGPTGGYLIGFIFMAWISGWFIEKFEGKFIFCILGMILGSMVMYLFGTIWLAKITGNTFGQALISGVLPFLLGDALKIIVAAVAGSILRKQMIRAGFIQVR